MNTTQRYIVGNWKAQLSPNQCEALAKEIASISPAKNQQVWVAPPMTGLSAAAASLKSTPIKIGAQNVWHKSGAFTGETTIASLKEIGATFSLVGHSERRHVFGETTELCNERCLGALNENFTIIFCVGETLSERESNKTNSIIEKQLSGVLAKINNSQRNNLIIAYEPVWAIGTGKVATTSQIAEVHSFINNLTTGGIPILYGGSVTPDNFTEILSVPHVDGGLIGGASLKLESFSKLVSICTF